MFTYPFWPPKTEGRSRSDWKAAPFWGPKSHLWAFLVFKKQYKSLCEVENTTFPMISASLLWSPIPSTAFTVDVMQKLRNHSFYNRKLHTFWCSATLFGTSKRIKTEVRSRSDCPAGPAWAPKSPLCGPLVLNK